MIKVANSKISNNRVGGGATNIGGDSSAKRPNNDGKNIKPSV